MSKKFQNYVICAWQKQFIVKIFVISVGCSWRKSVCAESVWNWKSWELKWSVLVFSSRKTYVNTNQILIHPVLLYIGMRSDDQGLIQAGGIPQAADTPWRVTETGHHPARNIIEIRGRIHWSGHEIRGHIHWRVLVVKSHNSTSPEMMKGGGKPVMGESTGRFSQSYTAGLTHWPLGDVVVILN